ncbi:unnamed protein product [Bemisia tabaci]|uniref:Chitin-binding type-2 domain-containing protein n=1 Tax=Bemisia tabaci TaxID=7038 RepID=A0AAI8UV47_BEMTA|nr:unnamed protein product [Bemisia tabaci]
MILTEHTTYCPGDLFTYGAGYIIGGTCGNDPPALLAVEFQARRCRSRLHQSWVIRPTDIKLFRLRWLQDFRFLCPNNTAFDQENQICDDWYNIDCEAATLFYSDNFDLFRIVLYLLNFDLIWHPDPKTNINSCKAGNAANASRLIGGTRRYETLISVTVLTTERPDKRTGGHG